MATTEEIIVKKGIDLVWQNPRRDKNCIIKMPRMSPRNGYNNFGKVHWDLVECPTKRGYYHFYQLGDNFPGDFSLISNKNQWYKLSDWCRVYDLVIRIYDQHGKLFPLQDAYVMRVYNDNLIIAVMRNDSISDINEEELYINFYRNFFYTGADKDPQVPHIEFHGLTTTKTTKPADLLDTLTLLRTRKAGKFRLTHNGELVETLKRNEDAVIGEVSELHYDMSVRKVVDFPISQLRTFKSVLDNKNKYLLHPPKDGNNTIDYRDDLEIFICHRDPKTREVRGRYYHRNMEDAVRMVTHRDWSLPVPYVMGFVEQLQPERPNLREFFIRVYVKDNGGVDNAIDDSKMINALYLLSDTKIIEAMTAVDSTVPEWKAANLEQSAYTALMRSYHHEITPALVLDAFGYNTTAKFMAYPNIRITPHVNGNYFEIPIGIRDAFTVFEYNQYGKLLNWSRQVNKAKYYPKHASCIFIEAYSGHGGPSQIQHVGNQPFELKNETAYRFYLAKTELRSNLNNVVGDWKDATGDERIVVSGTTCQFKHDNLNEIGVAIGDSNWLCYEQELDGSDGIYDFTLTNGAARTQKLIIPPGKIDLFLNGNALIEGIDYYIDFPYVMIVNKRYIDNTKTRQTVLVRCMGFPFQHEGSLKRVRPREVGFVKHGLVSVDDYYDIHAGRVLRTVVDGGVFDPDVIPFDERGDAIVERFAIDGSPYSVETPYIAMGGVMGVSLYRSQIIDYDLYIRASAYLTEHAERTPRRLLPVIPDKYEVYSPFLSKIAADLKYGRLLSALPKVSIAELDKIIQPYKRYLNLDPVIRGYDKNFVNVHVHPYTTYMSLNARDVAFIERLNQVYLRGEVDTSKFFQVRR